MKKIIEIIKKKWLRDTIYTILLISVFVLGFIALNMWISTLEVTNLDFTEEKLYTLSDESKELVKNIDKDITIYFVNFAETSIPVTIAKQYKDVNEKISTETVIASERKDIAQLYGIQDDYTVLIIVKTGEKEKILEEADLYTYDETTWERIDISEQKMTNAILEITSEEIPTIYFLTGHEEYSTSSQMMTMGAYIQNEVMEVMDLNLLSADIPEDCQTIVIATPSTDFYDSEVEKLTAYINRGGNIIWMQDPLADSPSFPNMQKILDLYGVSFNNGIVAEQDSTKMIMEAPYLIIPNINYTTFTEDLTATGTVLLNTSSKLSIADEEKLTELNVIIDQFLTTSETAFYRTDLSNGSITPAEGEEIGSFTVGALFTKDVTAEGAEETVESKLIAFSNNLFATDYPITIGNQTITTVMMYNNKDLVLNSIAYTEEKEDQIRIRKNYKDVVYTPTEAQNNIVLAISFGIPLLIVVAGIILWQVRRRRK